MSLRMPLGFHFDYTAPRDSKTGTIHDLHWTDLISLNKLVTIGMIARFESNGVLNEDGSYLINVEKTGWFKYRAILIKKD